MNAGEWTGIVLMLTALAITVAVLAYDAHLALSGQPTISSGVWNKLDEWQAGVARFPWRALLLPAGVGIQSAGLALHFYAGLK